MSVVAGRRAWDSRQLAREFGAALEDADAPRAHALIEEGLESGLAPLVIYRDVITPSMRRIGDLWERGKITVADEHLATAIVERVLPLIYVRGFVAPPRSRELVLVACLDGEQHQVGARIAADLLEGAGFVVLFLGANVPLRDLVAAVERHRPAAVALSVTVPPVGGQLERALMALQEVAPGIGVVLGGPGVRLDAQGARICRVGELNQAVASVEAVLS